MRHCVWLTCRVCEEAEKRRARLQFAFDAFVELHCEVAPGTHVGAEELHEALVVYMNRAAVRNVFDHRRRAAGSRQVRHGVPPGGGRPPPQELAALSHVSHANE
jgi:hypothetical protein